jgi:hypothetical protein
MDMAILQNIAIPAEYHIYVKTELFWLRWLVDYSATMIDDLNYQANCLSDLDLRSTPLLQRYSVIFGYYEPHSIKTFVMDFSVNVVEPGLMPRRYNPVGMPRRGETINGWNVKGNVKVLHSKRTLV